MILIMTSFNLHFLAETLQNLTARTHFVVGYSGGVDSHVLLHAMASLRKSHPEWALRAIYIHHGISAHADTWQTHCEKICRELNVSLTVYRISVDLSSQEGVEGEARKKRYEKFSEALEDNECLLMAHHQDDQAETLLLQLIRGAGIAGLSAMPAIKPLGKGELLRPFLSMTRDELIDYAKQEHLEWIEDDTNHDLQFARNYLRKTIFPLLKKRWPSVAKTLSRSAEHCANAQKLINELTEKDYEMARESDQLSVNKLRNLTEERQKNVLRYWIQQKALRLPTEKQLRIIVQDFLWSAKDANPLFLHPQWELFRSQDCLCLRAKPV